MVKTKKKIFNVTKPKCCTNEELNAEISQVVKFLKAISEENRLKVFCLLKENEKCVCGIWQCIGLTQSLTSYHLKTLKNLGLISSRREGLKITYSINEKVVQNYSKLLNKFLKLKL